MIVVGLLILLIYTVVVYAIGYFIFSPFRHEVARAPIHRMHFQLTDLLALFLPFQLGFATLNFVFPDINWNTEIAIVVSILLLLISATTWLYGMRILWRMNVTSVVKRIALLGLVMPVGAIVSATALPIVMSGGSAGNILLRLATVSIAAAAIRFVGIWVRSNQAESPLSGSVTAR